jgi:hypothetical protein
MDYIESYNSIDYREFRNLICADRIRAIESMLTSSSLPCVHCQSIEERGSHDRARGVSVAAR